MNNNSLSDEGVIKYQCTWKKAPPGADWNIEALNNTRDWLHTRKLIGINKEGIGYGNISIRYDENRFVITGSATGHLETLGPEHYTLVTSFDHLKNHLYCTGPIKASSESMTHGMLYRADSSINAVIHIHNEPMWRHFTGKIPTSDPSVPYGTPEMALEIERLYKNSDLPQRKAMVMGGHFEGIIAFGVSLNEALEVCKMLYEEVF